MPKKKKRVHQRVEAAKAAAEDDGDQARMAARVHGMRGDTRPADMKLIKTALRFEARGDREMLRAAGNKYIKRRLGGDDQQLITVNGGRSVFPEEAWNAYQVAINILLKRGWENRAYLRGQVVRLFEKQVFSQHVWGGNEGVIDTGYVVVARGREAVRPAALRVVTWPDDFVYVELERQVAERDAATAIEFCRTFCAGDDTTVLSSDMCRAMLEKLEINAIVRGQETQINELERQMKRDDELAAGGGGEAARAEFDELLAEERARRAAGGNVGGAWRRSEEEHLFPGLRPGARKWTFR